MQESTSSADKFHRAKIKLFSSVQFDLKIEKGLRLAQENDRLASRKVSSLPFATTSKEHLVQPTKGTGETYCSIEWEQFISKH